MIDLTDTAKEYIMSTFEGAQFQGIRFGVKSTGCSGYQYVLEHAVLSEIKDTDLVIERDGISIVIDPEQLEFIKNVKIDYNNKGLYTGFVYTNPNSKAECGCGMSFTITP